MISVKSNIVSDLGLGEVVKNQESEFMLPDFFAKQVHERPLQTAVVSESGSFTYEQLHRKTDRWALFLRELGARPNTLVAVVMEKGVEQVVACLSILKAGAAYLPIDPELPSERLAYIIENSEAEIILTQSWLDPRLEWPANVRRLCMDSESLTNISDEQLEPVNTPDDLAFVIYTSGSTGTPKGVMLAHRGVVNCIRSTNAHFDIGPNDRVLALTALHHDMSVYDIFGILAAGGTIVMPNAIGRKDPAHWSELMLEYGVTIWNSVPAMMEMLLEYVDGRINAIPDTLRLAFLGGDWIPVMLPKRLQAQVAQAKVVSVGGPTETTLWNIWYPVEDVDREWKNIPYGKPIANTKYFVMDEDLEECPSSTAGELCCAGTGLAKGYWKDKVKTDEKFTTHPRTGERIYRTGDMGRLLPDGNIEFLGRTDNQVKINGQRVELGEIEAVLQQHDQVRGAVVVAVGEDRDQKQLAAYIVPASCQEVAYAQLREYAARKLPVHMVPSLIFLLDHFPLTANGKVDRGALPKLNGKRPEMATPYIEPQTKMEQELAGIWQELLHLDNVGVEDNLFDLGAQSIHVVQAHSRFTKLVDTELRIVTLFQYPTIRSLAKCLTSTQYESFSTGNIQAQANRQRAAQAQQQIARGRITNV